MTLARAVGILGGKRIVSVHQAATARGVAAEKFLGLPLEIRYSEATLRECAIQNRDAGTDWRLVPIFGLSPRELREQIGTDPSRQPCCYSSDWWLQTPEDGWATAKPEAGYWLIDFNGRFACTSWNNQESEIAKLGPPAGGFLRTRTAIIAEAITTIFQVHNERLLESWYHWGPTVDSNGNCVYVGYFGRDGWRIKSFHPECGDLPYVRVCLARRFESPA